MNESSDNFCDRALRWLPGGSNGEYGIPEGDAPVIDRGAGCRVWDTAGHEYLDMTMAWGAALVGHAHPKVLEAANAAAARGANFAAVTRPMVELAERIADISPCVERIRVVASGTEGAADDTHASPRPAELDLRLAGSEAQGLGGVYQAQPVACGAGHCAVLTKDGALCTWGTREVGRGWQT